MVFSFGSSAVWADVSVEATLVALVTAICCRFPVASCLSLIASTVDLRFSKCLLSVGFLSSDLNVRGGMGAPLGGGSSSKIGWYRENSAILNRRDRRFAKWFLR